MQSPKDNLAPPSTISIGVGYAWAKKGTEGLDPLSDGRWQALREHLADVANAVKRMCERRPGPIKCSIEVRRLRARHGSLILDSIRERIATADVLIMDLGAADGSATFNDNVLLETGMALGMGRNQDGRLFVLSPKKDLPSDLQGVLRTDYVWEKPDLRIVDARGFHAALRGKLITLASERGMMGAAKMTEVIIEDDDPDGKGQPVSVPPVTRP